MRRCQNWGVVTVPEQREDTFTSVDQPWNVVVWNDSVNLMSYVTYVFQTYFGYPEQRAHRLMMEVHEQGRATVAHGGREPMEQDVSAMHSYGLWATLERSGA